MADEKPTGDAGASIVERIEAKLSAQEDQQQPEGKEVKQEQEQGTEVEAKPDGDETQEDEGPQYELSDVAKILGVEADLLDVDEDGTLKIKTKIDGSEGVAKLKDFIASYQLKGHADNRVRQVAEQEKALSAQQQQFEEFASQEVQRFGVLVQAAQQTLMDEFQGINWDQLAIEDPVTHIQKKQAFETRSAKVNQLMAGFNDYQNKVNQALAYRAQQQLATEAQRLPSLIPEWANPEVAESEKQATVKWLMSNGVGLEALNGLNDAAMVKVLRNAMKAASVQSKAPEVEKKLRAAPKLIKPGSPQDAGQRAAESVRSLKEQIRKTGGKGGSVAEYLLRAGKV